MKEKKIGVLLVNLGTPDTPLPSDVRKYLIEFLTDGRVIDSPWIVRQWLVRAIIVPRRYRQSAAAYKTIWTENGSPLKYYGCRVKELLQKKLGDDYVVTLAMRYQYPSIESGLDILLKADVTEIVVIPMFPQYASATTGSIYQKVMESLSKKLTLPKLKFIDSFPTHPKMIEAFCSQASTLNLHSYDHILFSFHGLPRKQLIDADTKKCCQRKKDCCSAFTRENQHCYSAQCYATAQAIAQKMYIHPEKYSIAFQSRLGKDPWIQPYTSEVISEKAHKGIKNMLVFCPSFVCDCLETISEIGDEYAKEFKDHGGIRLDLVPGLNDHPMWIETLDSLVKGCV